MTHEKLTMPRQGWTWKLIPVLLGAMAMMMAGAPAKKEPAAKEAPWVCACECAKCPPKTILSKNKGGEYRYRNCFRDANTNSRCDGSSKDNGQCQNDCIAVDETTNKGKKKVPRPPCPGCPCAGNCAQCAAAPQNEQ